MLSLFLLRWNEFHLFWRSKFIARNFILLRPKPTIFVKHIWKKKFETKRKQKFYYINRFIENFIRVYAINFYIKLV